MTTIDDRRRPKIDARIMATARLYENLAERIPAVRDHIALDRARSDGHTATVPGGTAHRVTDLATRPPATPAGDCEQPIPSYDDPTELVDCGRRRPCPDHDIPVGLTSTEAAAERRLALAKLQADLDDQLALAATIAHRALSTANRILGLHTNPGTPPTCTHTDGCNDLAGYDMTDHGPIRRKSGLCDEHELERLKDEQLELRSRQARYARNSKRAS